MPRASVCTRQYSCNPAKATRPWRQSDWCVKSAGMQFFAKLDILNPGGSIKDRDVKLAHPLISSIQPITSVKIFLDLLVIAFAAGIYAALNFWVAKKVIDYSSTLKSRVRKPAKSPERSETGA